MCGICGCGEGETRVEGAPAASPADSPRTAAPARVEAGHAQPEGEPGGTLREEPGQGGELLKVEQDLLSRNDALAAHNREHFRSHGVLALNLVSSPGAGKTRLLVETLARLVPEVTVAVIEGDQETSNDAERIRATGAPAVQVNTGRGCHLDAAMVDGAFRRLHITDGILFIENVGNLVCPAGFDLGEAHKVVIASVTEGEDKPLKYPNMFAAASLMLVSKVDLLPHLDFDLPALVENARRVNPGIAVIEVSARDGTGMDRWLRWLDGARAMAAAAA